MKIRFLKDEAVYDIKHFINKSSMHYFEDDSNWISDITGMEENYEELNYEFPDFDLVISDTPEKDDLKNMKIMYTNLKELSDSQASDERLWAGLCHDKFWSYMKNRWPITSNCKNIPKFIKQHYFFENGTRSLLLNGLSRLWWYARLTYDESNEINKFELTEYLAKDINGKAYMFFGSNFSNNRDLQRTFLYTIKEFEEEKSIDLTRKEFNSLRKKVVLWSGKLLIDCIESGIFRSMLLEELNKIYLKRSL